MYNIKEGHLIVTAINWNIPQTLQHVSASFTVVTNGRHENESFIAKVLQGDAEYVSGEIYDDWSKEEFIKLL